MTKHKVKIVIDEGTEVEQIKDAYLSEDRTQRICNEMELSTNHEYINKIRRILGLSK